MSGEQQHSAECCRIPPVISDEYKEKGEYKELEGLRTYFTGPTDTGKTILLFFDIFSFAPQTIQGADIMAASTNSLVIMPDFFKGETLDHSLYPPKSDEDMKKIVEFVNTTANPQKRLDEAIDIAKVLNKDGKTKLGAMGFCWGGKMATLSGATSLFEGCASIHPGMLSADDAKELKVPIALFISKDESQEEAEKFMEGLTSKPFAAKNQYKRYANMDHGWASARANFKDPAGLKEYEDVYAKLAHFFNDIFA